MQVNTQIETLIQNLRGVQDAATAGSETAQADFENILNTTLAALKSSDTETAPALTLPADIAAATGLAGATGIPDWVDTDYGYDPENPRKPNMRELMEALSGRSVEDMYADPSSNWQNVSRQASELLYGVVGSNKDTRDWLSIMSSTDIVGAARKATGAMYEPVIDIASEYSEKGILVDQVAVLKDKSGAVLRALSENTENASETLNNFGATSDSVPGDLANKANSKFLSDEFIAFLENFRGLYEREQFAKVDEITTAEALSAQL